MDSSQRGSSPPLGSSPVSTRDAELSRAILTPRSKIRAMMAKIDESDNDDDETSTRPLRTMPAESPLPETQHAVGSIDGASSNEDDEDVPLPRGRLAARLRGTELVENADADSSSEHEGAYERLKRELAQKSQAEKTSAETPEDEDDESLPQPAPMRRMLFTKKKAGLKSPTPSAHGSDAELLETSTKATRDQVPILSPNSVSHADSGTDSDTPPTRVGRESYDALVAKKTAERKKREAKQQREHQRRLENLARSSDRLEELIHGDADADSEDAHGTQTLASHTRPTRKASKRAIEEMNRETQRMSRNMQLAHAATTRKKLTKESLFAKFNFRQPATAVVAPAPQSSNSSLPSTSRLASDAEPEQEHHTPPTSPASPAKYTDKSIGKAGAENSQLESLPVDLVDDTHIDNTRLDEELPTLEALLSAPLPAEKPELRERQPVKAPHHVSKPMSDKARGKQKADPLLPLEAYHPTPTELKGARVQNFRVKLPSNSAMTLSDSDSDLEIAPVKPLVAKLDAILAKAPQTGAQTNNKIKFRALAHLTSPGKRDKRFAKASIPAAQMQFDLLKRAREQTARERQERLDELKARGIIIQTAEEREKDQMVTEDLLEKARKEVQELTRREKEERKKGESGASGEAILIDESDDESYIANGTDEDVDNDAADDEEDVELQLSGSDEDEDIAEDIEDDGGVNLGQNGFFDNEADEGDEEEGDHVGDLEEQEQVPEESDDELVSHAAPARRNRVRRVIDDEDEDGHDKDPEPNAGTFSASEPTSPAIINPFGNAGATNPFGAAPMGLTQAFAATMDATQSDDEDLMQESSAIVVAMPEPNLPVLDQEPIVHEHAQLNLASPEPPLPSMLATQYYSTQRTPLTQDFEMPDPTQDSGFIAISPIAQRFASVPPSTVETVLISNAQAADTVDTSIKRKGRLLRRGEMSRISDDEAQKETTVGPTATSDSPAKAADAFSILQKAEKRRQRMEEFNKKKSAARDVVYEQAEESEDEYAGLGGASDDESGGEMDEEVRKMLDDDTQLDLNESQLAAFHANKERMSDEQAIKKLYKDINNGGLRRKRGNDFLDDDSDDEAERRLRLKRAEFARMRKALLADERVGKIAEDPKKSAFLKALEDRDDADDLGHLDEPEPNAALVREESIQEVPDSQPKSADAVHAQAPSEKRKRALEETDPNNRLPPHLRRTKPHLDGAKKPATFAEIRESISSLVEDSRGGAILVPATQSDDEPDKEDAFSISRFEARRRANPVVDRLSLKRAESANSNGSGGNGGRAAFFTKGRDEQGFRTPSLLKKATTLSAAGEVTYLTERTSGRKENEVKKGGTKKSSVAYFAREVEKRKAVDKVEKRREVERKNTVENRRGILRGLGAGKFE